MPAAIVSASHNPWTDNGVKVIGADGRKLPDDAEAAIEAELASSIVDAAVGLRRRAASSAGRPGPTLDAYVAHLLGALDGRTLDGLARRARLRQRRGVRSRTRVLSRAPAPRVRRASTPNPTAATSTTVAARRTPRRCSARSLERGADVGLALDGDADRVLAVDEHGELVDGDQIMVMTALDMHARGVLRNDAIAVTVMSNLGLRRALRAAGIGVVETPVGDRHVVAAMAERDLVLGGEQSGHIVFADLATTGDGVLTGLIVADLVAAHGRPLSALAAQMTRVPQVLVNVRLAGRSTSSARRSATRSRAVEAELGERGRVLVRASGTEPLVRVMVEAPTEAEASAAAARIKAALEA